MSEEKQVSPLHSAIVDIGNAKVFGIRHILRVFLEVNAENFEWIQTLMEITGRGDSRAHTVGRRLGVIWGAWVLQIKKHTFWEFKEQKLGIKEQIGTKRVSVWINIFTRL